MLDKSMPKGLSSGGGTVKISSTLSCTASPTKNWKSSSVKNETYDKSEKMSSSSEISKSSSSSSSFPINDSMSCLF